MAQNIMTLRDKKVKGEKITCLTAYDASFASLLDAAGIDIILVGDSLGMVVQGHRTTLPVSIEEMEYHTTLVARGAPNTLVIADMPFMSDSSVEQALIEAGQLIKAGARVVKLEGAAAHTLDIISQLSIRGVPVCGHLGLQPQSVNKLGGYRVQGKDKESAEDIMESAFALEQAGADLLVLECVPAELAQTISQQLKIPTIGIGAGVSCDGQVLVLYDMLGITPGKRPKFSKDFLAGTSSVIRALEAYRDAVIAGQFPGPEHSF